MECQAGRNLNVCVEKARRWHRSYGLPGAHGSALDHHPDHEWEWNEESPGRDGCLLALGLHEGRQSWAAGQALGLQGTETPLATW